MAVQVYGCNHVVIEVTDAKKAVKFYSDVFGLKMLRGGEGAAWCKLGEHQFMAIFEVEQLQPDRSLALSIWLRTVAASNAVRPCASRARTSVPASNNRLIVATSLLSAATIKA